MMDDGNGKQLSGRSSGFLRVDEPEAKRDEY